MTNEIKAMKRKRTDMQTLHGKLCVAKGKMEFTIHKCLADGDDCCKGVFRLL